MAIHKKRLLGEFKRAINFGRRHLEDIFIFQNFSGNLYRKRILEHAETLPPLCSEDSALVKQLRQDGVAITSCNDLAINSTPLFLEFAYKIKEKLSREKPGNVFKELFLLASPSLVSNHSEIFLWGLNEKFLNIAETYLELPVAYHGMYFHRDFANVKPAKSKLWHRDMEDYRSLKIIVYLNDIYDESCGPMQFIPKSMGEKALKKLGRNYGYIEDSLMQSLIPSHSWQSCLGPEQTVILMDTAQLFHRGKVPRSADRFAIFFDYTSRYPKRPYYCKSSLPKEKMLSLASGLSDQQIKALFWRDVVD
ncbi:hypothetical protein [Nodosilinea sp. E11]|uniref:hypothetical protein n=1 Tax=Nodosilinea sp. E11 TaxID=3037479 RepID=UPI002934FE67|nr:hypothetical protein [Nodosilinea sp. E11]WOD37762.1 hypothetical protein RRF56_16245 [Nodosilinea sp. E11]